MRLCNCFSHKEAEAINTYICVPEIFARDSFISNDVQCKKKHYFCYVLKIDARFGIFMD